MNDSGQHPDVFTTEEALRYMHLPTDSLSTLETLRVKGLLRGELVGRMRLYSRKELDACVAKLFAYAEAPVLKSKGQHNLRLTGSR